MGNTDFSKIAKCLVTVKPYHGKNREGNTIPNLHSTSCVFRLG